jgi:large subunit ribosomal protein L6
VDVKVADNLVTVKGPKGELSQQFSKELGIEVKDGVIHVTRPSDDKKHRSLHGLTRTLIHNMVEGVVNGYSKTLEIDGVGYRAAKQGKNLVMNLGFSHQVIVSETDEISIEVPQPNQIIIKGIDKQKVGQFAAEVREKRLPEPYKGKGIHYLGERIIRKEGKAGKGKK